MANRPTHSTIGGVHVIRFNGNNCTSGRERGTEDCEGGLKRAPLWVQAKARAQAVKRTKEAEYVRRYLSDDET